MRRYNSAREDSRTKPKKTIWGETVFFIHISGLINSFGLALVVGLEEVVLLQWIAAGPPNKSM